MKQKLGISIDRHSEKFKLGIAAEYDQIKRVIEVCKREIRGANSTNIFELELVYKQAAYNECSYYRRISLL